MAALAVTLVKVDGYPAHAAEPGDLAQELGSGHYPRHIGHFCPIRKPGGPGASRFGAGRSIASWEAGRFLHRGGGGRATLETGGHAIEQAAQYRRRGLDEFVVDRLAPGAGPWFLRRLG